MILWYQPRMRVARFEMAAVGALALLAVACDEPDTKATKAVGVEGANAPKPPPKTEPKEPEPKKPEPVAKADAAVAMPERPVPKTEPTVRSDMPPEVQMRAIAYMAAMTAPHVDDVPPDKDYATSLEKKLLGVARSLDKSRSPETRIEMLSAGRRLQIELGRGCTADTPKKAVVQNAGESFAKLLGHGILVISCHDDRYQCLQSTRDPSDVLCTSAPRRK